MSGVTSTYLYDALIIGAGPAGTAAAYDLARAGRHVLIVDRRAFPRPKACAAGLTMKTLARLRYSVEPVIRHATHAIALGLRTEVQTVGHSGELLCALSERGEFDAYCLEQTIHAGAQFAVAAGGIRKLREHPRWVEAAAADGSIYRARFVVGADGAKSVVRRLVEPRFVQPWAFALEGSVPLSRLAARPDLTFDFGVVDGGYGWVFPKDDHVNVGLYTTQPARAMLSKESLRDYVRARLGVDTVEQIVGAPLGLGGARYRPTSARVLLAGDAAGTADALLGEGIHNAIASGQVAAACILRAFEGAISLGPEWLASSRALRRDIANCTYAARLFYGSLPYSYRTLALPWLRDHFIRGFASGLTFTECLKAPFGLSSRPTRRAAGRPAGRAEPHANTPLRRTIQL